MVRWSGDQVRLPEVQEGWKLRELCCVVCDPGLQLGRLDIEDFNCLSCTDPVILSAVTGGSVLAQLEQSILKSSFRRY